MIGFTITWLVFIAANIWFDGSKLAKGERWKSHTWRFIIRAAVGVLNLAWLWHDLDAWNDPMWKQAIKALTIEGFMFLLVFDHAINLKMKWGFLYIGRTAIPEKWIPLNFGLMYFMFKAIGLLTAYQWYYIDMFRYWQYGGFYY